MAKPEPTPLEPDPPIPRIRSQAFNGGEFMRHGRALLCPRCGHGTLRYLGLLAFDREAEGRRTNFVRVYDTVIGQYHMPVQHPPDPNNRWHGVVIEFGCESCVSFLDGSDHRDVGHGIWLEVVEDQEVAAMCWCFDPLPEDWDTPTRQQLEEKGVVPPYNSL